MGVGSWEAGSQDRTLWGAVGGPRATWGGRDWGAACIRGSPLAWPERRRFRKPSWVSILWGAKPESIASVVTPNSSTCVAPTLRMFFQPWWGGCGGLPVVAYGLWALVFRMHRTLSSLLSAF